MPVYEFKNPKTNEIFEEYRSFADSDKPFFAPDGTECHPVFSGGMQPIMTGINPSLADLSEENHKKKVKDPERARRKRIKQFGTSEVDIYSGHKSEHAKIDKAIRRSVETAEIDKKTVIKTMAKDDNVVAKAQEILRKNQ